MHAEDEEGLPPRAVFARRFAELYALAGNPTLRRVATATERRMRGTGASTPSPQRISDWKAGRNVPARFDSLLPVVLTLVEFAEKTGRTVPRALAEPHAWQRRWQACTTWTAEGSEEATCPYPGLRAYRTDERALFFGRDRATAELTALVDAADGIVVLIGASGAGKSSLLAAGLVPALARPTASMTPGADPVTRLAAAHTTDTRVLVVDQFEELFTLCADDAARAEFLTALAELATRPDDPLTVVLALRADFYERCLHHEVLQDALQHRAYLLGPMRMDEVARALTGPLTATGLTLDPSLEELVLTELRGLDGHPETSGYDPGSLPLLSHVMAATWQQREGRRLTVTGYRKAGGVAGSVAATAELAWRELTEPQQRAAQELLGALVTVGRDSRDTRRTVDRAELVARSGDPAAATAVLEVLAAARLIAIDADSVQLSHEIVLTAWPRLRGWIETDRVGHLVRQRLESDAAEWAAANRDTALLYRGTRLDSATEHTAGGAASPRAREFLAASGRSARRGTRWRVGAGVVVVALLATGVVAVDRGRLADQRAADRDYAELVAAAQRTRAGDPSLSAQLALAAYRMRPDESTRTQLLNTQELPLAVTVPAHEQGVRALVSRPADKLLVSIDNFGMLAFWSIEDPARPRRRTTDLGIEATDLVFVPGGTDAITNGAMGIQRWDLADPESPVLLHTFGTDPLRMIAVSPSGDRLAELDSSALTLWRLDDRTRPTRSAVIPLPGDHVQHHVAFSPDGKLLATGRVAFEDSPGIVQLWDLHDVDSPRAIAAPITLADNDSLRTLAFSPDSTTLAIGLYGSSDLTVTKSSRVELWQITDPRTPRRFDAPIRIDDMLYSIAFHADGKLLATGSYAGARLWNIADPALPGQAGPDLSVGAFPCPQNPFGSCQGGSVSMAFLPGTPMLATGGDDGSLRIWAMPRSMLDRIPGAPHPPVFDRAGHRMAILHTQGTVTVWDTTEPAQPVRLSTVPGGPERSDPALSPDGRTLSVHDGISGRRIVHALDDPRDPRPLASWPFDDAHRSMVNGDRMLSIHASSVQLWDVADRAAPRPLGPPITGAGSMEFTHGFSADGARVEVMLFREEHRFLRQIWNLDDPQRPRLVAEDDADPVLVIQPSRFLPDNRTLAVAQADRLELWDTEPADAPTPITAGFATGVAAVMAMSTARDGLAVTGYDGTTALWDLTDPHTPRRLSGPIGPADGQLRHVVLHPDGEHLVVATDNGHLGVWNLDPDQVADRICASTGDLLTEAVWQRHLPNQPYRPPCA